MAYDMISVQYFHLGKMEKSQAYHERYMKRILEPK